MVTANDRLNRIGLAAQAVVLLALVWVGWQVRELRDAAPSGPVLSGIKVKAFATSGDGLPPNEVTVELYVNDTEAAWIKRLDAALEGLEKR